jgi:hypothetical protein
MAAFLVAMTSLPLPDGSQLAAATARPSEPRPPFFIVPHRLNRRPSMLESPRQRPFRRSLLPTFFGVSNREAGDLPKPTNLVPNRFCTPADNLG